MHFINECVFGWGKGKAGSPANSLVFLKNKQKAWRERHYAREKEKGKKCKALGIMERSLDFMQWFMWIFQGVKE